MTITITLQDEVENLLREKAKQRGMTLDSLATEIFDQALAAELAGQARAALRDDDGVFVVDSQLLADPEFVVEDARMNRDRQNLGW